MTRKIHVVTTFHPSGYTQYAQRMIQTFLATWPSDIVLHAYAEGCAVTESASNLRVHDLESTVPELVAFKQRYGSDPRYRGEVAFAPGKGSKIPGLGFKWDAIRFSHKVFAVCHAARHSGADLLFWMDADMVCHSAMSHQFLERMVPDTAGVAFLGRRKKYTETGLYALNLTQAPTLELVDLMQGSYERAEQDLFLMPEWHDCQVFDEKRAIIQRRYPDWQQINWSEHLVMGEGHPLVNTAWRDYLDHLKGDRKSMGRSKRKDMVEASTHHYWNQR